MSHLRQCVRHGCEAKETFWSEANLAAGMPKPEPPLCRTHLEEEALRPPVSSQMLADVALPGEGPSQIEMIGALLVALGQGDHARVESPRVVWEAALADVATLVRSRDELVAAFDAEEADWEHQPIAQAAIRTLRDTVLRSDR